MRESFLKVANVAVEKSVRDRVRKMMDLALIIEYAAPLFNTLQDIALTRPQPADRTCHFHFWYHFGDPKFGYWGQKANNIYIDFGWIKDKFQLEFDRDQNDRDARKPTNYQQLGKFRIGYFVDIDYMHIAESDDYRGTEYYIRSGEKHFNHAVIHDPMDYACRLLQRKVAAATYYTSPVA